MALASAPQTRHPLMTKFSKKYHHIEMIDHLDVKNPEIDCWVVNGKEQREEGETL